MEAMALAVPLDFLQARDIAGSGHWTLHCRV
jgi:hypothetical protein